MRFRGFSVIALDNPKNSINVGSAIRAGYVYNSSMLVVGGKRPLQKRGRIPSDPQHGYRHMPVIYTDDVFDAIPFDCIPVAVDLLPGAIPLHQYKHPERAFYIFGAEDATLGKRITDRCRDKIVIPTNGCMNLAATVNVVLYDRLAKLLTNHPTEV